MFDNIMVMVSVSVSVPIDLDPKNKAIMFASAIMVVSGTD